MTAAITVNVRLVISCLPDRSPRVARPAPPRNARAGIADPDGHMTYDEAGLVDAGWTPSGRYANAETAVGNYERIMSAPGRIKPWRPCKRAQQTHFRLLFGPLRPVYDGGVGAGLYVILRRFMQVNGLGFLAAATAALALAVAPARAETMRLLTNQGEREAIVVPWRQGPAP